MKHLTIKTLLIIAAICPAFIACNDDKEPEVIYEFSVKAEDSAIAAPAEGCSQTILVTSTKTAGSSTTNVAYEVKSAPEWAPATIEQTALVINVVQNSTTQAREPGSVTLIQAESGKELTINITQTGYEYSMSLAGSYTTPRCKVLSIAPEITGFDKNPVFAWTVKGPEDSEATAAGNGSTLNFIKLETGEYEVSLTVTDDSGISQTASSKVTVTKEDSEYSPYISEVTEYRPGPYDKRVAQGKFNSTDTYESALKKASELLSGKDIKNSPNNSLSTGTMGGYIVFKFDHTVMNVEGLRDFRIGSYQNDMSYYQPAVVFVAFDKNCNGVADDDEWFEIAGSEYSSTQTRHNVTITYTRPENPTKPVTGSDYISFVINGSENGFLGSGNFAPTYWPAWMCQDDKDKEMTFTGITQIQSVYTLPDGAMWPSFLKWYEYGYASNNGVDETQSSIDIDWAVDKDGKPVHLPGVDFVKVQSSVIYYLGMGYGASCSLINCAIDLHLTDKQIKTIKR